MIMHRQSILLTLSCIVLHICDTSDFPENMQKTIILELLDNLTGKYFGGEYYSQIHGLISYQRNLLKIYSNFPKFSNIGIMRSMMSKLHKNVV